MKKTLAAVLAAAMALSTATVALAKDTVYLDGALEDGKTIDPNTIVYGKEYKQYLSTDTFTRDQLGQWLDDNVIKIDTIVTENRNSLEIVPTLSVKTIKTGETIQTKYVWKKDCGGFKAGTDITKIPVKKYDVGTAGEHWGLANGDQTDYLLPSDSDFDDILQTLVAEDNFVSIVKGNTANVGEKAVQVKFKVRHTYGTGDTTVKMKFKITFKKDAGAYSKGDTYTTDEIEFKTKYGELNSYSDDMVLTLDEVDEDNGCNVLLKGDKLYDEVGNDTFSIQFEDTAVFEAKAAASQKKVNLYYDLDEISEVTAAYPEYDFEFITFRGNPSFVNSGTMTFNAIGGKNTTVYTWDGTVLEPLNTTYDSSYKTVTAKNVKKLGAFVVASDILPVEEEPEEPAEPVDSTPVAEPDDDEGENPNTGAC